MIWYFSVFYIVNINFNLIRNIYLQNFEILGENKFVEILTKTSIFEKLKIDISFHQALPVYLY